jgi:hypothetical protein
MCSKFESFCLFGLIRRRKIAIYAALRLQMELLRLMNILSKETLRFFSVMRDQDYLRRNTKYATSLYIFLSMAVALPL